MTRDEFVTRYGAIYEHSAWVAQRAFDGGASDGDDLAAVFERIVERAGEAAQLALLRAHPDLAGRLGQALTADSASEQAGAGLDQCTPAEFDEFQTLNTRYTARFGFPFIIAVKGLDRPAILAAFRARVDGTPMAEFRTALDEVHKIAGFRLKALLAGAQVETERVALSELESLAINAFLNAGADRQNAEAVAETMVAAERDGSVSHGVFRVAGFAAALRKGIANGQARPRQVDGPDAAVIVDGDGGSASLAYKLALPALAEKADRLGAAVLCLRDTVHYAAMWHEVEALAEQGLAAFACTANLPYVAPYGGKRAFSAPTPSHSPFRSPAAHWCLISRRRPWRAAIS